MSSLAVSAFALLAILSGDSQTELSPHETEVWRKLQPCFATLMRHGVPGGTAALIDPSGLFLAHQSSFTGSATMGVLSNGHLLTFTAIGYDTITHSALLQAQGWQPDFGVPIRVPVGDEVGHGVVFAVLPSGPIRAAFTNLNRPGFFQAERRIIPLNEVHFEAPDDGCAGALLIDEDGELLGVLGATLTRDGNDSVQYANTFANQPQNGGFGGGGGGVAGGGAFGGSRAGGRGGRTPGDIPYPAGRALKANQRMGPSNLTVAYTAGVVVLRRVVDGFKSPDHHVGYPSIGLYCKDTPGGGALVQAVQPESPADRASIEPGDVLTSIAGAPIRNQVDFALVMLNQNPGDKILIRFKRRNRSMVEEVSVGRS